MPAAPDVPPPSDPSRRWLVWGLRLIGAGLLAWLLLTQVQWSDRVRLADGTVLAGEVVPAGEGAYRLRPGTGAAGSERLLSPAELGTRAYGGRDVPDVRYGARTLLGRLRRRVPDVAVVLGGLVALVLLTAARWRLLMRGVGLHLAFWRTARLTFIGGFFNLAVPGATGGDVVKAWYAAKDTGAGTRAVLSVFVDRFVGLFALVLFAAGALFTTVEGDGFEVPRLLVLGLLAGGVAGGALVLSRPLRRALGLSALVRRLPFQRVIEEVRASARLYRGHPTALAQALGISLFNHAGNATAAYILARALGIEGVALGTAMALVPVANLMAAIPVLPGGWGVGELAFAYFFGLVGVPATEAVGLSVVFRLATLGVNVPGGVLWIFWRGHPSTARIAAEMEETAARVGAQEEQA